MRVALRRLALGLHNRLQVDLDLAGVMEAAVNLRNSLRSYDAQLAIHRFEGLLQWYSPHKVHSLQFTSNLDKDRVEAFQRLLDDQLYRQLSSQGYFLGIPGRVRQAMHHIKQLAKKIAAGRGKTFLKLAATPVNLVAHGVIDISAAVDLMPDTTVTYMPPIAWFPTPESQPKRDLWSENRSANHFPERWNRCPGQSRSTT